MYTQKERNSINCVVGFYFLGLNRHMQRDGTYETAEGRKTEHDCLRVCFSFRGERLGTRQKVGVCKYPLLNVAVKCQ